MVIRKTGIEQLLEFAIKGIDAEILECENAMQDGVESWKKHNARRVQMLDKKIELEKLKINARNKGFKENVFLLGLHDIELELIRKILALDM